MAYAAILWLFVWAIAVELCPWMAEHLPLPTNQQPANKPLQMRWLAPADEQARGTNSKQTRTPAEEQNRTPAEEQNRTSADDIEVLIVGDVMAHLPQVESARRGHERYDFSEWFALLEGDFAAADLVVANLETTLTHTPPYSGYPSFASPEELARDMAEAGIDAVSVANNHTADKGTMGLLSTVAALDNAGIEYVGAAVESPLAGRTEPLITEIKGCRIALLAYTYGSNVTPEKDLRINTIDTAHIRSDVAASRTRGADFVVALMHWGQEYSPKPSAQQQALGSWLTDECGVDFVVGSHPHVIQPWHAVADDSGQTSGAIFYSLGNFVSNQNDPHTELGLMARLRLTPRPTSRDITAYEISYVGADTLRRVRKNYPPHPAGTRTTYQVWNLSRPSPSTGAKEP